MTFPKRRLTALAVAMVTALALVGAGCGDDDDDAAGGGDVGAGVSVTVADKGFSESSIIAQAYSAALANQGFETTVESLASTEIADAAVRRGDITVYPEYTGTAYGVVLGEDAAAAPADRADQFEAVRAGYEPLGLTALTPAPFSNGNEVACTADSGVTTLEDLGPASADLVYSANAEHLTRDDGLPLLQSEYGVEFQDVTVVDISLRYKPIEDGDAQCVYAFGTDPKLAQLVDDGTLVVLEDGKGAFTGGLGYQNFAVVNTEFLDGLSAEQREAFVAAVEGVDALLTPEAILPLIAAVEFDREDPADVAETFLSDNDAL